MIDYLIIVTQVFELAIKRSSVTLKSMTCAKVCYFFINILKLVVCFFQKVIYSRRQVEKGASFRFVIIRNSS